MWRATGPTILAAALIALPAGGKQSPEESADALVEKAKEWFAETKFDSARMYVDRALKRAPDHAEANALHCMLLIGRADADSRNFTARTRVVDELKAAAQACGRAADLNRDDSKRENLLRVRLRALLGSESWDEAGRVFETLMARSPDDGRLIGGYAAALDLAGRAEESRAALLRAAERGTAFDRAARFEFVWDRFDRADAARLSPMIAALQAEETDPRRRAVLDVLNDALTPRYDDAMLGFLALVERKTLNRSELDKLWSTLFKLSLSQRDDACRDQPCDATDPELEPPVIVHKVVPVYPKHARGLYSTGRVELIARINADGSVFPVWIARATALDFAKPAYEAVLARRYIPAKRNGEPVPKAWTIRIDFKRP